MAKKTAKFPELPYGEAQKAKLLARWDGTVAGAGRLGVAYASLRAWRAASTAAAGTGAEAKGTPRKEGRNARTSALDDALELLFQGVHVGRIKTLAREDYVEELKRVRVLQRIVGKAVAEGKAPQAAAMALAKHFDALIEGL